MRNVPLTGSELMMEGAWCVSKLSKMPFKASVEKKVCPEF
jgi:hypothetical protein